MDNKEIKSKVASLESQVDLLEAELVYLHEMLIRSGFPEGIKTLKATIEEYLAAEEPIVIQRKKKGN